MIFFLMLSHYGTEVMCPGTNYLQTHTSNVAYRVLPEISGNSTCYHEISILLAAQICKESFQDYQRSAEVMGSQLLQLLCGQCDCSLSITLTHVKA